MGMLSSAHKKDSSLAGCILPLLMGGLLLFMLVLVAVRISEKETRTLASQPEPPKAEFSFPADVPRAYLVLSDNKLRFEGTIEVDKDAYIICGDKSTHLSVEFEALNSIKHLWNGSGATFKIIAPFPQTMSAAVHHDTWPDVMLYEMDPFTPVVTANFLVEPEAYHQWLTIRSGTDITYPVPIGATSYENKKTHVEREFKVFVVTSEDINRQAAHDRWEQVISRYRAEPSFIYKWFWLLMAGSAAVIVLLGIRWKG